MRLTGQAPRSPSAGFLPPNDAQHRGEGFVTYTIRPKAGLATGAEIRNEASIVFDVNPAIVTNETIHTIDAGAPSSEVADLPAQLHVTSIPVTWSGDDENGAGSGIAGYDVYVSTDGGPYQRWLANTARRAGSTKACRDIATPSTASPPTMSGIWKQFLRSRTRKLRWSPTRGTTMPIRSMLTASTASSRRTC